MTHDLDAALRSHFGFDSFRTVQREVVQRLLAGGDTLVLMPTGEGKSLCYQLPALLLPGTTLVVSPLIALMEDQVIALRRRGIAATCVHSLLAADERERRIAAIARGECRLAYVTPERFRVGGFLARLANLRVSLFVVDEAHCVSQWGHDFRPDYQNLGAVRAALGSPVTIATTATATPAVQDDIREVLGMREARTFSTGIARDNLFLACLVVDDEETKAARLIEILDRVRGPGIVYFALIADLRRVEDLLRRHGVTPLVYHGDLSASERKEQQRTFLGSRDALVLATNAFGMGVDKPDIRFVLHWQVPRNLESYYQEIGRAGRDGGPALCELLYREADLSIQREFLEWANPDRAFLRGIVAELANAGDRIQAIDVQTLRERFLVKNRRDGRVETCLRLLRAAGCCEGELGVDFTWLRTPDEAELEAWTPEGKRQRDLSGLLAMVRYARCSGCRKALVHEHFGIEHEPSCHSCDACVDATTWLGSHLPAPALGAPPPVEDVASAEPPTLRRGAWIEVAGLGLCTVLRVHETPRGTTVDVETHDDLTERSFDPARRNWRLVDRTP